MPCKASKRTSTCPFAAPLWRTGSRTVTQTPSAVSLLGVFGTRPESQKWHHQFDCTATTSGRIAWVEGEFKGKKSKMANAECGMWNEERKLCPLYGISVPVSLRSLRLCETLKFSRKDAKIAKILFLFWIKKSPNSVIRQIKARPQRVRGWCRARTGVPVVRGSVRARGLPRICRRRRRRPALPSC